MFSQLQRQGAPHGQAFRAYKLFSADGGKPVYYFNPGIAGLTSVKNGSPERVQELLGILNWLAAPFGSQEALLLRYGLEGTDFTVDAHGNPVPTDRGPADSAYVPWRFLASPSYVLYDPSVPNFAQISQSDEKDVSPFGIHNVTDGLYSPTAASTGVTIGQTMDDRVNEIIRGQRPIAGYDQLLQDWRANGGDKMRAEYQQALGSL